MFGGFLRKRSLNKCKAALNALLVRIEGIKRKRIAMQKYLKNDIADLLKNGFHLDAYRRVEALVIEINKDDCYYLVELFCNVILDHLSAVIKQKECPGECKEAVPSLMFAAARFADLPELRELRTLFIDKYGKTLEPNINREFVEKLMVGRPTKDMKVLLLQDMALEFDIEWDPKALEQQLYKPPLPREQIRPESTDDSESNINKSKSRHVRERDKQNLEIDEIGSTNDEANKKPVKETKLVSYSSIPPPYTRKFDSRSVSSRSLSPNENKDPSPKVVSENNHEEKVEKKDGSHSRANSLPRVEIGLIEKKKGHERRKTSPDTDCAPKLLDYDDFIARLAALNRE